MFDDQARIADWLAHGVSPRTLDHVGLHGLVVIEVNSQVIEVVPNLITDVGDQLYAEQGSGAGTPNVPSGMRLGTGSTAVAKTGAGAAIVSYESGTAKAIDGGFPTSTQPGGAGTARRITYKSSWAAGEADGVALREVVLTNETPLTDSAGAAADTISRALFGPMTLGALDTLSVTWYHDLLGS